MNFDRRKFVKTATLATTGLAITPDPAKIFNTSKTSRLEKSNTNVPIMEAIQSPVIIKDIQLLEYQGNFICKVVSEDGHEGIGVSNNLRMKYLYPIFLMRVAPFFKDKDARDIENLINGVYGYRSNYKMQSYALWVPVATIEFAILDMLGKLAGKSIGALVGTIENDRIGVYQANDHRGKSAEESIELIKKQIEETNSKALKFKVGGRMSHNADYPPGRTEKLIPMIRKTFGDEMVVYADSNGSYTADEAIRIGRLMEEHAFDFYEEPVPFDWYGETLKVSKALDIPIAGGEQEASMRNFQWLIETNALDIVQPDIFYFGGMIRSMKVAKMAAAAGKSCVPHISGSGLGYLYMMHFVSALPNAGPYHEFKGFNGEIPLECTTSDLKIKDGYIKVPTGPGLGVDIDGNFLAKHRKVSV